MFVIPDKFARDMITIDPEYGPAWIEHLPTILEECAQSWRLTIDPPFALSFNYAAPAMRHDGTPVVLKVFKPNNDEFPAQALALQHFAGHGSIQLLDYNLDKGAMLLERSAPGTLLSTLEDDEKATTIAASIMRQLWRPEPLEHTFPTINDWGKSLLRIRERYAGGSGPFPSMLLAQAETLYAELSTSMAEPVLLHGDLHHENILAATRQPWLAIDPKGVIGEPAYETGALVHNHLSLIFQASQPVRAMQRRVDVLAAELGLDRQRIRDWGVVQAVLSVWWSIEDFGQMDDFARAVLASGELLAAIKG